MIAVPITIIKLISTVGAKEKNLMVLISIKAENVLHEPCVNRLWGAIGSVGGAELKSPQMPLRLIQSGKLITITFHTLTFMTERERKKRRKRGRERAGNSQFKTLECLFDRATNALDSFSHPVKQSPSRTVWY